LRIVDGGFQAMRTSWPLAKGKPWLRDPGFYWLLQHDCAMRIDARHAERPGSGRFLQSAQPNFGPHPEE
jgi:hypothetical protein